MLKILLKKFPGSRSRSKSEPKLNRLLLVRHPAPQNKFHKNLSTTSWVISKICQISPIPQW